MSTQQSSQEHPAQDPAIVLPVDERGADDAAQISVPPQAEDEDAAAAAAAAANAAAAAVASPSHTFPTEPRCRFGSHFHGLGKRAPVTLQPLRIPPDVLQYIWTTDMFGTKPSSLVHKKQQRHQQQQAAATNSGGDAGMEEPAPAESEGMTPQEAAARRWADSPAANGFFAKCIDYGRLPHHVYYEGYFHGMPHAKPVESLNPRTMVTFPKPAAPLQLRAFLAAIRECNRAWIDAAQARFRALGKTIPCADMLASVIADGRLFSDLAVQMHCGDGVPFNMLGWHNDGPNSLLHFSLTLAGQRCLFMAAATEETGPMSEIGVDLFPGAAYFSSPTMVSHAPQYPDSSWDDRTVAIQCRLNLTQDEMLVWAGQTNEAQRHAVGKEIADILAAELLQMPTIEQVRVMEERLVAQRHEAAPAGGGGSGDAEGRAGRGECVV